MDVVSKSALNTLHQVPALPPTPWTYKRASPASQKALKACSRPESSKMPQGMAAAQAQRLTQQLSKHHSLCYLKQW